MTGIWFQYYVKAIVTKLIKEEGTSGAVKSHKSCVNLLVNLIKLRYRESIVKLSLWTIWGCWSQWGQEYIFHVIPYGTNNMKPLTF